MGEAKRRGTAKERIDKARARNQAIQDRIGRFAAEVGTFGKKTGLDLGPVKLDARFVILKFDDLTKFVENLPFTDEALREELQQRWKEVPEEAPKVPWYRRLFRRIKK